MIEQKSPYLSNFPHSYPTYMNPWKYNYLWTLANVATSVWMSTGDTMTFYYILHIDSTHHHARARLQICCILNIMISIQVDEILCNSNILLFICSVGHVNAIIGNYYHCFTGGHLHENQTPKTSWSVIFTCKCNTLWSVLYNRHRTDTDSSWLPTQPHKWTCWKPMSCVVGDGHEVMQVLL